MGAEQNNMAEDPHRNKVLLISTAIVAIVILVAWLVTSSGFTTDKRIEKRAFETNPNPNIVESEQRNIERRAYEKNSSPDSNEETNREY